MSGSTLREIRGHGDAPPDAALPVAPPVDSDDLIALAKLVLSRMDDDEAAGFAVATLLDDVRRTLQPLINNGGTK